MAVLMPVFPCSFNPPLISSGTLKHQEEPGNQSENKIEKKKANVEEEAGMQANREQEALLNAEKEAIRKAEEDLV
jgi:hypothetical protein